MKSLLKTVLFGGLVLVFTACEHGSDFTTSESVLSQEEPQQRVVVEDGKNYALMGPLANASVKVFRSNDLQSSIEENVTSDSGVFRLSLDKLHDDEVVLVTVSGGEDIDANDDGIVDDTPLTNMGTLHAFAKVSDLKQGKVHVSLLSEVVYQYTKHLFGHTSDDDMYRAMATVTAKLVENTGLNEEEYLALLFSFVPSNSEDREKLSFDYSKLIDGNSSLSGYIRQNSPDVESLIDTLFAKVLTMNDQTLLKLRTKYLLELSPPMYANVTSVGSEIFYNRENNTSRLSDYVAKDANVSFSVVVDDGYKIVKWYGCSEVSSDKSECKVNRIQKDTSVAPVVVPDEIVVNPNIRIVDISQAEVSLQNDLCTVKADPAETALIDTLSSVSINDVIVNKFDPVFFKKVVSVQKKSDSEYVFETAFIPIEEVLTQGYVSVSTGMKTVSSQPTYSSAKIVFPNGKSYPLTKNEDNSFEIDFAKLAVEHISIEDWNVVEKKWKIDEYTTVFGKVKVTPYVDFDMAWEFFNGLTMFYVKPGVDIQPEISIDIEKEWKGYREKQIFSTITSQVFFVGPIPIAITEEVKFLLGVEGSIKTSLSIGASFGADIGFPFRWTKDQGISPMRVACDPHFDLKVAEFKAEGTMGGYVNILPNVNVYGLGFGIANKFGIYGTLSAAAGLNIGFKFDSLKGEKEENVKMFNATAETYLQYQPEFRLVVPEAVASNENIKEIIDNFDKNKPQLPKLKIPIKKWEVSLETKPQTPPGNLEVIRGENYETNVKVGSTLNRDFVYELKNTGGEDIYWSVGIASTDPLFSRLEVSQRSGKLAADESTTVTISMNDVDIEKTGKHFAVVQFNTSSSEQNPEEENSLWTALGKLVSAKKYAVQINAYRPLSPVTGGKVEIVKPEQFSKLRISFTPSNEDVDGYIIYKADYDKERAQCYYNYGEFARLDGKDNSVYEVPINALVASNDPFRTVEGGKSYCFNIVTFKDENGIRSISEYMKDTPAIEIPKKLDVDQSKNLSYDLYENSIAPDGSVYDAYQILDMGLRIKDETYLYGPDKEYFEVTFTPDQFGRNNIALTLKDKIDYEKKNVYQVDWIVVMKSTGEVWRLKITVNIKDVKETLKLGPDFVSDTQTHLMWERMNENRIYTLQEAQNICSQSTTAGFEDWRLPTKDELVTIHNPDHYIEPGFFYDTFGYWTGETCDAGKVWAVDLTGIDGEPNIVCNVIDETEEAHPFVHGVRCVRNN